MISDDLCFDSLSQDEMMPQICDVISDGLFDSVRQMYGYGLSILLCSLCRRPVIFSI